MNASYEFDENNVAFRISKLLMIVISLFSIVSNSTCCFCVYRASSLIESNLLLLLWNILLANMFIGGFQLYKSMATILEAPWLFMQPVWFCLTHDLLLLLAYGIVFLLFIMILGERVYALWTMRTGSTKRSFVVTAILLAFSYILNLLVYLPALFPYFGKKKAMTMIYCTVFNARDAVKHDYLFGLLLGVVSMTLFSLSFLIIRARTRKRIRRFLYNQQILTFDQRIFLERNMYVTTMMVAAVPVFVVCYSLMLAFNFSIISNNESTNNEIVLRFVWMIEIPMALNSAIQPVLFALVHPILREKLPFKIGTPWSVKVYAEETTATAAHNDLELFTHQRRNMYGRK